MPSLGLGLGTHIPNKVLLDSDVAAFKSESGATDVSGLNDLVKYLKAESLYNNFVIYPMKSAQNAGSGATVYSLGGLTDNDMTLVNSPTWGASGITFNSTNQYSHIADFLGSETIYSFIRRSGPLGATNTFLEGQYDFAASERSWAMGSTLDDASKLRLIRSLDGGTTNWEQYTTSTGVLTTADTLYVAEWVSGGGRSLWTNKTSQSLSLILGSAQTTRLDSSDAVLMNAVGTSASATAFPGGTYTARAICNTLLTTTQRETITDYINAL